MIKNLFAYCDNTPIIRVDIDGDFWVFCYEVMIMGDPGFVIDTPLTPLAKPSWNIPILYPETPSHLFAQSLTIDMHLPVDILISELNTTTQIEFSKTKDWDDPDPHTRPGQKKQGRERKVKKKGWF